MRSHLAFRIARHNAADRRSAGGHYQSGNNHCRHKEYSNHIPCRLGQPRHGRATGINRCIRPHRSHHIAIGYTRRLDFRTNLARQLREIQTQGGRLQHMDPRHTRYQAILRVPAGVEIKNMVFVFRDAAGSDSQGKTINGGDGRGGAPGRISLTVFPSGGPPPARGPASRHPAPQGPPPSSALLLSSSSHRQPHWVPGWPLWAAWPMYLSHLTTRFTITAFILLKIMSAKLFERLKN